MQHGSIEGVDERRSQASQPQARRLVLRPPEPSSPPEPPAKHPHRLKRRWWRTRAFWLTLIVLGAVVGCFGYSHFVRQHADPVPAHIRKSVSFAIYYPQADKLPAGYYLDTSSFSTGDGQEVIYVVRSSGGQRLVFSLQPKPTASQLQIFYAQHLPLHSTFNTPVGVAVIGAIGPQTVVSLPTNGSAWLLITCPQQIDKHQLREVLAALVSPS